MSPEIRVIQEFTPQLISTISSYVQEVSDQCLAHGLISGSKYKQLLGIPKLICVVHEDKVRMLLQTIKDNITMDRRCFKLFLDALSNEMPHASQSLLSSIKDEHHKLISIPSAAPTQQQSEESDKFFVISEKNVLDKLQEATEKSVLAIVEKEWLENELALKIKRMMNWKRSLRLQWRLQKDIIVRKM